MNFVLASLAAVATLPLVALAALAVWLQDGRSPFYVPLRVGLEGRSFRFYKLRSMVAGADDTKVDTTIAGDPRVTRVGRIIRRFKLDELPQFWNVILGDMVLVGPRPNVRRETDIYTAEERRLLGAKPGVTDLSSIVFSDLEEILSDAADPNIAYNQLIRPWKSRLALFYVDHRSVGMDLNILLLTGLALVSRPRALRGVAALLQRHAAPAELVEIVLRSRPLVPTPPPGAASVVVSRDL